MNIKEALSSIENEYLNYDFFITYLEVIIDNKELIIEYIKPTKVKIIPVNNQKYITYNEISGQFEVDYEGHFEANYKYSLKKISELNNSSKYYFDELRKLIKLVPENETANLYEHTSKLFLYPHIQVFFSEEDANIYFKNKIRTSKTKITKFEKTINKSIESSRKNLESISYID